MFLFLRKNLDGAEELQHHKAESLNLCYARFCLQKPEIFEENRRSKKLAYQGRSPINLKKKGAKHLL